ncbi:MAG TPA: MBL fold metallo-hydrolase [Trebonia sp.]|nr:MBL fold metallo-hydrolase [Trebonia sp.]
MSAVPPGIIVSGAAQRQAWIDRVLPPVEMVRPGLWSIPTPFTSPLRYVLSYAIEYDGGVALVDTGWPAENAWEGLVSGLARAGRDITDVKAVLVTHGHGDHIGLARRIREASGAWVALHEADANPRDAYRTFDSFVAASDEWLRGRGGQAADFRAVHGTHVADAPPPDFADFVIAPDKFLVHGERPLGPGTGLVAVHTPGHTPGHVCFHDTERNVVLTGDHILPRITPNISPSPAQTEDLLGQYLDSLSAMSDLPAEEVLPAHEYRFIGLAERIGGLRAHHERRLAEVMTALHAAPGASTVVVAEALSWSRTWPEMVGPQRRFAVGEAYSHLVHLERTGYAANKGTGPDGTGVDAWHALRDAGPKLVQEHQGWI